VSTLALREPKLPVHDGKRGRMPRILKKARRSISRATGMSKSRSSSMKPALRSVVAKLKRKLRSLWSHECFRRFEVAQIVLKVRVGHKRYGARGVEQLATELGLDKATVYRWARVAEVWAPGEFRIVIARRNKAGLAVTWSHLEVLAEVSGRARRETLLEKVLAESLSVRQLRALVGGPAKVDSVPVEPSGTVAAITLGKKGLETALASIDHLSTVGADATITGQLESLRILCETTAKQIQALLARNVAAAAVPPARPAEMEFAAQA
jgi:hypothetical protein